eukprot:jgi/Bigna1/86473/estExt_fgenesh1_pg.C_100325
MSQEQKASQFTYSRALRSLIELVAFPTEHHNGTRFDFDVARRPPPPEPTCTRQDQHHPAIDSSFRYISSSSWNKNRNFAIVTFEIVSSFFRLAMASFQSVNQHINGKKRRRAFNSKDKRIKLSDSSYPCGINSGLMRHGSSLVTSHLRSITRFCPLTSGSTISIFGVRKKNQRKNTVACDEDEKQEKPLVKAEPRSHEAPDHTKQVYATPPGKDFKKTRTTQIKKVILNINSKFSKMKAKSSTKTCSKMRKKSEKRKYDKLPEGHHYVRSIKGHFLTDEGIFFRVQWWEGDVTEEPLSSVIHMLPTHYAKEWEKLQQSVPSWVLSMCT